IARSFQIPKPFVSMTLLENLCIPLEYAAHLKPRDGGVVTEAMEILDQIGLADRADARPADLTQINMRKLELARAIAAKPRLLISDEAMA
ncbi:MAG: ATP-binding cassette domain-containing protein, partial [Nitrospinota bacterium]